MKSLLLFFTLTLCAQTPAFEVASIKPNTAGGGVSAIHVSTGRVGMENVHLKKATLWAYGIPDDREYQLAGPDWLTTEHFDIQATFPAETSMEQVRAMMQTLLAQRFKLALHNETRQLPLYVLVQAKNGSKLHEVAEGSTRTSGRPGRFEATKTSMPKFADLLARYLDRQVVDETGLRGVFDFTLQWTPDETEKNGPSSDGSSVSGPSLFSALQEQLGLKLEARKGPVEVLVVDHIEKSATAN